MTQHMTTRTSRLAVGIATASILMAAPSAALAQPAGDGGGGAEREPAVEVVDGTPVPSGAGGADEAGEAAPLAPGADGEDAALAPATGQTRSSVVTLDLYNLTDVHGHIEQVVKKGVGLRSWKGRPAMPPVYLFRPRSRMRAALPRSSRR